MLCREVKRGTAGEGDDDLDYRYSVIIPVYNAEKTLGRCLDSLVSQAKGIAEIILINDGSKDASLSICREYENRFPNIKLIDQENAGASAARNAGLDAAQGRFITFVDSDDYVPEHYFETLEEAQDADFAIFAYYKVKGGSSELVDIPRDMLETSDHHERLIGVVRYRFAAPSNKRFKKAIIEDSGIRFRRELIIGEDFLFGLSYMLCCETSWVSDHVVYYYDVSLPSSVTRSSRFHSSQYSMIYRFAFPIAEQCNWGEADRMRLLRQLDYHFCRTSFVAAERLLRSAGKDCSLRELIQQFYDLYRWQIEPLDSTHAIMKFCLKNRLLSAYRAVAFLHSMTRR